MIAFFNALSGIEQIWWGLAILSSIAFALKLILTFAGIGGGMDALEGVDAADGLEASADGALQAADTSDHLPATINALEGLNLFSIQNILAFFCLGSWGCILSYSSTGSALLSTGIGLVLGVIMMFLTAWLMRAIFRLESNGTVKLKEAVGMLGTVYLTIPPRDKGRGKVNLDLGGSLKEYDAVSQDDEPIKTGTRVRVIDLLEDDLFVVQKESEELE